MERTDTLGIVGRIIYAVPFAIFGCLHFIFTANLAGTVPSWLPAPEFWVYMTGAAMLAASVAMLSKKAGFLASVLLAGLLATFILTVHLPGMIGGQAPQLSMTNALKDFALLGGALMVAGQLRGEARRGLHADRDNDSSNKEVWPQAA